MNYSAPQFSYAAYEAEFKGTKDKKALLSKVVNLPFTKDKVSAALIFLGIIVVRLVNKKTGTIDHVALTSNEFAHAASSVSIKKFVDIKIPIGYRQNVIAEAVDKLTPTRTNDWSKLFTPVLTKAQSRINQANAGIACSVIYPLIGLKDGGAVIYSYYQYPEMIGQDQTDFMETYTAIVSTALKAKQI